MPYRTGPNGSSLLPSTPLVSTGLISWTSQIASITHKCKAGSYFTKNSGSLLTKCSSPLLLCTTPRPEGTSMGLVLLLTSHNAPFSTLSTMPLSVTLLHRHKTDRPNEFTQLRSLTLNGLWKTCFRQLLWQFFAFQPLWLPSLGFCSHTSSLWSSKGPDQEFEYDLHKSYHDCAEQTPQHTHEMQTNHINYCKHSYSHPGHGWIQLL